MICQNNLYETCRMGRSIVVIKLICSLGHCECDGHTVHKVSRRRLTADWLAPRENGCSRMHSKVSSDWLPSYIKATQTVLEILKMDRYFPDSPGTPWTPEGCKLLYNFVIYLPVFHGHPCIHRLICDSTQHLSAASIILHLHRLQCLPKCSLPPSPFLPNFIAHN